jgi:hypothetical protein
MRPPACHAKTFILLLFVFFPLPDLVYAECPTSHLGGSVVGVIDGDTIDVSRTTWDDTSGSSSGGENALDSSSGGGGGCLIHTVAASFGWQVSNK